MEPEMRAAVEEMRQAAMQAAASAGAATTAANASTAAANAATAAVHQVSRDVVAIRRDLGILWRHVHGSDRPPPNGDPERAPVEVAGEPAIRERLESFNDATDNLSLELAALEGRTIAAVAQVEKKVVDTVKAATAGMRSEIMGELRVQTSELKTQSKDMGIERKWYETKQGRTQVLALATLIVGLVGTIAGGIRAASSAPTPTIIVAPPPSPAVSR